MSSVEPLRRSKLAETLSRFMQRANLGDMKLASNVNALGVTRIHRSTIRNWRIGTSKRAQSCDQIVAIATVLHLNEEDADTLLAAAGHPSIAQLRLRQQPEQLRQMIAAHWQVSMPSVDGAGLNDSLTKRAFERWAEMPTATTESLPRITSLPEFSRVPFAPNPLFVGREYELRQIARALQSDNHAEIGQAVVVTGLGGMGKTQTANEFLHRYGQFFAGGVFWINFADPDGIEQEMAACAIELGQPAVDTPTLAVWFKRQLKRPIPRLLIFDNCESNELVRQYKPVTGGCRVLITSRRQNWWPSLGLQRIALQTLASADSVRLLKSLAPHVLEREARLLVEALHRLPLALHVTGCYLRENDRIPVDRFLQRLKARGRLGHPALQGVDSDISPTAHDQHIARTFSLSLEQLNHKNPVDNIARIILQQASFFAPNVSIPDYVLWRSVIGREDVVLPNNVIDRDRTHSQALKRVGDLGLATWTSDGLILHGLVAAFLQQSLEQEAASTARDCVETVLLEVIDPAESVPRTALLPHLRHLIENSADTNTNRYADLCYTLGWQIDLQAHHDDARQLLQRALQVQRRLFGKEHPTVAQTYDTLGVSFFRSGDYETALQYYMNALELRTKLFGDEHPLTLQSHNNLGYALRAVGRYVESRDVLQAVLEMRSRVLGENHIDTISTMSYLGLVLDHLGEPEAGKQFLERVFEWRFEKFGIDHPETSIAANYLGYVLHTLEDYENARYYYELSIESDRRTIGDDHPQIARNLNNIGVLMNEQGKYTEALDFLNRAMEINRNSYEENSYYVAQTSCNLGVSLHGIGRSKEAQTHLQTALTIWEDMLDFEHPDIAKALHRLGIVLHDRGKLEEAMHILERALKIRQTVLGNDHEYTAKTSMHLGHVYAALGADKKARRCLEDALSILSLKMDANNRDIVAMRQTLSRLQ
ncbi:MAG: tetratricopeptide repeat protein [Anaerolineae bacterium]|nr:tetratricopeptide repeat protein [Anaerolineae bacterium]